MPVKIKPPGDIPICPICGKEYRFRVWLDKHMEKEHDITGGNTWCRNCETIVPKSIYCINCGKKL